MTSMNQSLTKNRSGGGRFVGREGRGTDIEKDTMHVVSDFESSSFPLSKPSRYYNFIYYLCAIICTEYVVSVTLMLVTLS
jgi:hypothetical protein